VKKLIASFLVCLSGVAWGAIAFDSTSQKSTTTAIFCNTFPCTVSWTHTCTGSNLVLTVEANLQGTTGFSISGITYNSVALTTGAISGLGQGVMTHLWYLKGPTTGANTVSVTIQLPAGGSVGGMTGAISLTGVDQTTPVDVSTAGAIASATTVSLSTNTTKDNDWFIDSEYIQNIHTLTSTNGTPRWGFLDTGDVALSSSSSRGPLTPPGSYAMGYTLSNASASNYVIVGFMPVQTAATAAGFNKAMKLKRYDEE